MKLVFKLALYVSIAFMFFADGNSQQITDRSVLEQRKNETIREIEYTRSLLEQTRKSAEITVNRINLINNNISNRERLIVELNAQITFLNDQIEKNLDNIKDLEKSIDNIRDEYAKLLVAAYRNMERDQYLEYILGARDINQGYQRIKQLRYINDYRKKLYMELEDKREQLFNENVEMSQMVKEASDIRNQRASELSLLNRERNEKQSSVNQLRTQERKLRAELTEKMNIQRKIEEEINKIIEAELARAKERNMAVLTPAERILSDDFAKNVGNLPWPVERGVITGKFGRHPHPVIRGVEITNNGIDINTVSGEKARSIFDGEVTKVVAILGANYSVIVKHGEFYSVYTNLVDISVKAGDKVRKNDYLGTIYTDRNSATRLHFQIWRDKNMQNPENWLAK